MENAAAFTVKYLKNIPDQCNKIIIAMHGFEGSKNSGSIKTLEDEVLPHNIGVVKFDWPSHGEDNQELSVDLCLKYLDYVVNDLRKSYPLASLYAFSTSFGGYLTMNYNNEHPDVFEHIFLRSPALNMYDVLTKRILTTEVLEEIYANGSFTNNGIRITSDFVSELKTYDLFKLDNIANTDKIKIFHGTADELVLYEDIHEFSKKHDIDFVKLVGCDHRYTDKSFLKKVIDVVLNDMYKR